MKRAVLGDIWGYSISLKMPKWGDSMEVVGDGTTMLKTGLFIDDDVVSMFNKLEVSLLFRIVIVSSKLLLDFLYSD